MWVRTALRSSPSTSVAPVSLGENGETIRFSRHAFGPCTGRDSTAATPTPSRRCVSERLRLASRLLSVSPVDGVPDRWERTPCQGKRPVVSRIRFLADMGVLALENTVA